MKRWLLAVLLPVWMLGFTGCEMFDSEEPEEDTSLTFENASHSTIDVYPLTTEWTAFTLKPGELKRMEDIRDIDYRFEPDRRVQEGSASTDRYIIFVDAPPP